MSVDKCHARRYFSLCKRYPECGGGSKSGTASSGDTSLKVRYDNAGANANSISGAFEITNKSKKDISFAGLEIRYYLTNDRNGQMVFDCYYAGLQEKNGQHTQIQGIKGTFGKHKGKPVADVLRFDPGYYSWILGGDFTYNTKQVLTRIKLREAQMKS